MIQCRQARKENNSRAFTRISKPRANRSLHKRLVLGQRQDPKPSSSQEMVGYKPTTDRIQPRRFRPRQGMAIACGTLQ